MDANRKDVPNIVAYVFAVWSYLSVQNTTRAIAFMMQPDNAQVIAVFCLLNIDQTGSEWLSNLVQIGSDVYTSRYSSYLSHRDQTVFFGVFDKLNLKASVRYETFESLTEVVIDQVGPVRSLVPTLIMGKIIPHVLDCSISPSNPFDK